jgi:hypothetical protein
MNEPIFSTLNGKNLCTQGQCECTWYWSDPFDEGYPNWYGNNTCSCYRSDNSEPCQLCDSPSFGGTIPDQVAYTPCYSF